MPDMPSYTIQAVHATQKKPESGSAFSCAVIGSIRFQQPKCIRHIRSSGIISKPISSEGLISNFAIFLGNNSGGYSLQKYDPFFNISQFSTSFKCSLKYVFSNMQKCNERFLKNGSYF